MYKKQHLNFLLNTILSSLNLQWTERLGLMYKYNLPYGSIQFIMTKDKKELFLFLGLDYSKYLSDSYTLDDFINIITECKYIYLPQLFVKQENLTKSIEEFHTELKEYLRMLLENQNLPYIEPIKTNFYPFKDSNRFIQFLDNEFNKGKFLIKSISKLNHIYNKESKKFIKNKFNGKLIMQWIPELKSGNRLGEVIEAFKTYVEKETNTIFNLYIKNTKSVIIRSDFIDWYETNIQYLDKEFNSLSI